MKEYIISSTKIRRPLGDSEEDHQKLKEQKYKVFFKAVQDATNLTTRVCLFSCIIFNFLVSGSWLALKPSEVVGKPLKPTEVVGQPVKPTEVVG